jgi:hypothetical protein
MCKRLVYVTSTLCAFCLLANAGSAQLSGLYEFDGGGDGSSWEDAANWEQKLDPNGNPISGDPATPPAPVTSADVPSTGVVISGAGQTALDVNVGTGAGTGNLTVTATGDITLRDLNVGADGSGANPGALQVHGGTIVSGDDITIGAGSTGTMNQTGGNVSTNDDFNINANSSVSITGGTLHIGDRLNMDSNADLVLDGGQIIADDDFYIFGDSTVTVHSGLMTTIDKLRFDDDDTKNGRLTINGGIVRSNEFGLQNDADLPESFRGVVEINGSGVLQVQAPTSSSSPITQLTVEQAKALILEGVHLVTSAPAGQRLGVQTVIVPDFFGEVDAVFTQISVVPEPTSLLLLVALGVVGCAPRRRVTRGA